MLPIKYRLKKRKQFNYIYKHGKSVGSDCLTLVYSFCRMPNIKVGFSASKKVGNSVVRHRALRRMREALKPLVPQMSENINYIFVAKDTIPDKSFDEIKKSCEYVLKKANLIKTSPQSNVQEITKTISTTDGVKTVRVKTFPINKYGQNTSAKTCRTSDGPK